VALTPEESALIESLSQDASRYERQDALMSQYYEGEQVLLHMGLAVPPELRMFTTVINWCRVMVDTIENRQDVKAILLPGEERANDRLRAIWEANNLDSDLTLLNLDRMIYGRYFLSVGANEDDDSLPLVTVESPRQMTVRIDPRKRVIEAALRLYGRTEDDPDPKLGTLYLPNVTVWIEKGDKGWAEVDRDEHNLGRVPVIAGFNRRRSGEWLGRTQMADIIPVVDAAARTLTNLQLAVETHAVPQKWVLGVSKGDFVGKDGQPLPEWLAYYSAIWANQNKDAKVGQFAASDLKNFHETVNLYGQLASTVTGFPARYFGQFTTNPPAEGAIRADENQMVKSIERQNTQVGTTLGWAMGLAWRFATGEWVDGNRIATEWFDPGTPTLSQREDALSKRRASGVLSREGYWDDLGWSEARKDRERERLRDEANDMLGIEPPEKPLPLSDG
jgi:hypothetical protein